MLSLLSNANIRWFSERKKGKITFTVVFFLKKHSGKRNKKVDTGIRYQPSEIFFKSLVFVWIRILRLPELRIR